MICDDKLGMQHALCVAASGVCKVDEVTLHYTHVHQINHVLLGEAIRGHILQDGGRHFQESLAQPPGMHMNGVRTTISSTFTQKGHGARIACTPCLEKNKSLSGKLA